MDEVRAREVLAGYPDLDAIVNCCLARHPCLCDQPGGMGHTSPPQPLPDWVIGALARRHEARVALTNAAAAGALAEIRLSAEGIQNMAEWLADQYYSNRDLFFRYDAQLQSADPNGPAIIAAARDIIRARQPPQPIYVMHPMLSTPRVGNAAGVEGIRLPPVPAVPPAQPETQPRRHRRTLRPPR